MGISEKTVKGHLTNLFQRIGVADRTQAALWAERTGALRDRVRSGVPGPKSRCDRGAPASHDGIMPGTRTMPSRLRWR